ncbi:MAG: SPOR domain-containing protein, partial [Deltaproteobacteria bacterium]|nr:SPOR domain-containing protein [Deltaproteobacteria bacterium]
IEIVVKYDIYKIMNLRTAILLSIVSVCQILGLTASVPAIGADALPDSTYTIQVSSSREAEGADKHVAALKAHGLNAVSSYEAVEGKGMWYRVYVGRFRTKHEAETVASGMKAEGIISGYWIKELKDINIPPVTSEPSRAEGAVVEKEGPRETEAQLVDSGESPESWTGVEEQVRIESPQLSEEVRDAAAPGPSVDIEERAAVEEALPGFVAENPLEPRVGDREQAEAQPQQTPPEEEATPIIASSGDVTDKQAGKDSRIRRPSPGSAAGNIKRFYMGIRIGGVYMPGADEFTVSSSTTGWYFEEKFLTNTLMASYSLNKSFSLDFSVEKILNTEFNSLFATLGTKFRFFTSNTKGLFNLSPYVRGAPAWGNMSWDNMPGSFDSGIGGELGTGIDIITLRSNMRLGLDIAYRSMKFDYNTPSDINVTSSRDTIDFSGYSLTGFLNYYF